MKIKFNKWILGLAAVGIVASCSAVRAQGVVTSNNVPGYAIASTNPPAASNADTMAQLTQAGKNAYATLKSLSFKDGINVEPVGIYHHGDYGGGLAVSTTATNSINYGFVIAAIQETTVHADGTKTKAFDFYDGAFNVSYNGSTSLPVLGACDYYIETGAAADLKNPSAGIYNQSSTGLKKTWAINDNDFVSIGGGALYLTKWNDIAYVGFFSFTSKLHGKYVFGLF